MTYTYTSPKKILISATLEQDTINITTQSKNQESESFIYKYSDIEKINLSFVAHKQFATTIFLKNGEEFEFRNLSVDKGKFVTQSDQYYDWVLLLHDYLKNNDLNSKIEFTQGNSSQYYLYVVGALILFLLILFGLFILKTYTFLFALLIPSIGFVYMVSNIGITKDYNPEEIPGNYLP